MNDNSHQQRIYMKNTIKLLVNSISFLSLAFAAETTKMTEQATEQVFVAPLYRPVSDPFNYQTHKIQYYAGKNPMSRALFRGSFGIPGGLDPTLVPILQNLAQQQWMIQIEPLLIPAFKQLRGYIQNHGGPAKLLALKHIDHAIENKSTTIGTFQLSLLQGLFDQKKIAPRTHELIEHTIIKQNLRELLQLTFPNIKAEEFDNEEDGDEARFYHTHSNQFDFDNHVMGIPYFGEKFGIIAPCEAFFSRLAIIGIPAEPYEAHGVSMDLFSAIMHDGAHLKVVQDLDQVLNTVINGLRDYHVALGGNAKDFTQKHVIFNEQTRFLKTLDLLHQEAFRRFVGTDKYQKFALGLFLLTHEIVPFSPEMITSSDFLKTFQNIIDKHLEILNGFEIFESAHDPLITNPTTGVSALSNDQIISFMINKNKKEITKHMPNTKGLTDSRRNIKIHNENINRIELSIKSTTEVLGTETQTLKENLSNEIKLLKECKENYQKAFDAAITSKKLESKTGDFYDLVIELYNGKRLIFSEMTLASKAKNYKDTQSLMKIAGIKLPDIQPDADRETVQNTLKAGILAWEGVMKHFGDMVTHLFETTPNLSEQFFQDRFATLEKLKNTLQKNRNPLNIIDHNHMPDDLKNLFIGW